MSRSLVIAAIALLAACTQEPQPGNDASQAAQPALPVLGETTPLASDNAIEPEDMKGERGARHVLGLWAGALERGDWVTARAQWGKDGAMSGRTPEAFAREYARYRQIKVVIGRGQADAGAGSLFYVAPVMVSGITREGDPFSASGTAHLRRVNDVPGASAAQLRWHVERMEFANRP